MPVVVAARPRDEGRESLTEGWGRGEGGGLGKGSMLKKGPSNAFAGEGERLPGIGSKPVRWHPRVGRE